MLTQAKCAVLCSRGTAWLALADSSSLRRLAVSFKRMKKDPHRAQAIMAVAIRHQVRTAGGQVLTLSCLQTEHHRRAHFVAFTQVTLAAFARGDARERVWASRFPQNILRHSFLHIAFF